MNLGVKRPVKIHSFFRNVQAAVLGGGRPIRVPHVIRDDRMQKNKFFTKAPWQHRS
jgi:hypothetical protein